MNSNPEKPPIRPRKFVKLSNTLKAKRDRRFRNRKRAKGRCTRCPKPAKLGFQSCQDCLDIMRELSRNYRRRAGYMTREEYKIWLTGRKRHGITRIN